MFLKIPKKLVFEGGRSPWNSFPHLTQSCSTSPLPPSGLGGTTSGPLPGRGPPGGGTSRPTPKEEVRLRGGRSNRLVLLTATRGRPNLPTRLPPVKGSELERLRVRLKPPPTPTPNSDVNPEVSRKWLLLLRSTRAGDQETDLALSDLRPLHCAAVRSKGTRAGLRVVNGT